MSHITTNTEVTEAQMQQYSDLIYTKTGIRIPLQKRTLLSNRIRRRLRETGISDYSEYFKKIVKLPMTDPEWDAFLQEITTHETYLFRDMNQWDWFQNDFLTQLQVDAKGNQRSRSLRVWSAACSTGDEAFTIASCIKGRLADLSSWKIQIVGTDIGVGAVEAAKAALFNERAMRLVPAPYRKHFFGKLPHAEVWQPSSEMHKMTRFKQHNLMHPLHENAFDVIFLKNVLIYFDTQSKATVIENVIKLMRPGSYLVSGAAEGVGDLLKSLDRVQPWLYQMPLKD